jgi:hypothetical protein
LEPDNNLARFCIGPPFSAGIDELVKKIAVRGVNLDTIEPGRESILASARVLPHYVRHPSPCSFSINAIPLGLMADGGGRLGEQSVGVEPGRSATVTSGHI